MARTGGEGWNCRVGSWSGIPVTVHWTFFLLLLFQVAFGGISTKSGLYCLILFLVYGPILFFIVLLHELGHAWRCRSYPGGSVGSIMLWPLGGFTDCHVENGKCIQEFFIALCGPLMHIPQILFWLLIMAVSTNQGVSYFGSSLDTNALKNGGAGIFFAEMAKQALVLNIMLFALNILIPAYPLDGARLLASFCGILGMDITMIATIVFMAGAVIGLICLVMGIVFMVKGTSSGTLLLFLGIFALYTSGMLYLSIKRAEHFTHPLFQPDCYHGENREHNQQVVSQAPVADSAVPRRQRKQRGKKTTDDNDEDVEMETKKPKQKTNLSSKT